MTTLFLLVRLVRRLLALPGRLLIRLVDRPSAANGMGPLNAFHRGVVHGFVWVVALIAFSIATMPPAPALPTPAARTAPRYVPPPIPTTAPEPTETSAHPVEGTDTDYVPLPVDGDDDWDKPRICHRKWWC